jgi:hypothetical protein
MSHHLLEMREELLAFARALHAVDHGVQGSDVAGHVAHVEVVAVNTIGCAVGCEVAAGSPTPLN